MIKGIGIDICSIERIKTAVSHSGFRKRVFSPEEEEYADKSKNSIEHLAAAYAAKEALAKAGGWGIAKIGLDACKVLHDESGAPYFEFSAKIKDILKKREIKNVFLTITHDAGIAAAVVVLEG